MPANVLSRDVFNLEVSMLAADATKILIAARAGYRWVVTCLAWQVNTSVAQSVTVQEVGGSSVSVLRLPASPTGNGQIGPFVFGLHAGAANTPLRATPSGAGNDIHFNIEGYYELFA